MITYKDCPECGARKIHDTVRLCEVCETWERAEAAICGDPCPAARAKLKSLAERDRSE